MSSCAFGVLKAMQNFYFSRLLISSGFSLSKKNGNINFEDYGFTRKIGD